jgi:protein-tyrosine phosphatase
MIDIHSHILPGQDDGARSLEESLAMLRMAAVGGTTDIVASPHANDEFAFEPQAVEEKVAELQRAAGSLLRIHLGCELHLTPENIDRAMRSPHQFSIAGRGCVLVEFSDFLIPKTTGEILRQMMGAGLRPVIVHPERNPLLRTRMAELENWVGQGSLVQVTAHSLLGRFGKPARAAAEELISRGLAHFLASDAHGAKHRTPDLEEVRNNVEDTYGQETAERLLVENPRAVLEGVPISAAPPVRRRSRFAFWHRARPVNPVCGSGSRFRK